MGLPASIKNNIPVAIKHLFQYDDVRGPPFLISVRFLMAMLAFSAYLVQYMLKMMTSVAIVCMVNHTWVAQHTKPTFSNATNWYSNNTTVAAINKTDICFFKDHHATIDGSLSWDKDVQGMVLASFFWGYILTEIPGGYLSMRFGSKIVLFVAYLVAAATTLVLPVCARFNYGLFLFIRVVNGASLGVLWPSIASMWANWAPPAERSILISIGNSGSQIGNAIALLLGSYLCTNGFDQGWGSIFYIFGIVTVVWCLIWIVLSADSPQTHRFISEREKDYLLEVTKDVRAAHAEHESLKDAPWKGIMTSIPCISFYITFTCNNWGTYTFLTNIPTYMKDVLNFDIKSNGGLSAIPYILFWLFIIISGSVADRILKSGKLSRTTVRKIFCAISNFIPMAAVIGLMFIDCSNPYGGLALLCLGLAFTGTGYGAGFVPNCNDLAGNYAGILFGVCNTFATIPGIVAPYVVTSLTPHSLQSEWRTVFIISAVIYGVGGTQALIFTSGELQPWAVHSPTQRKSLKPSTNDDKKVIINQLHDIEFEHTHAGTAAVEATIQIDQTGVNFHLGGKKGSPVEKINKAWDNEISSIGNTEITPASTEHNIFEEPPPLPPSPSPSHDEHEQHSTTTTTTTTGAETTTHDNEHRKPSNKYIKFP